MHAVFFRWRVTSGCELEFERAWAELTHLIRDERGGLGSRLHRCADGHYFAYAQWPSKATRNAQSDPDERMVELRNRMRDCSELVDGPMCGDVVADLLVPFAPEESGQTDAESYRI